jgi:hypothetical protein
MQGGGNRSYDREVTEGFNAIFTYRGLPGQGEGRFANETWADTMAFLDRCAAIGVRVLFDFSQNAMLPPFCTSNTTPPVRDQCSALGLPVPPPPFEVIEDAVRRVKDHPALLSWYLIDEPDGEKYPPAYVHQASSIIRKLDSAHPISACFDTTNRKNGSWNLYVDAVDVLLADIYPVGTAGEAACTANASSQCDLQKNIYASLVTAINNTGKPLWFVPQAFGNQEGMQVEK